MRNLAMVSVKPGMLRGGRKMLALLLLVGVLSLAIVPVAVHAQASATASTSGFGAAFGYAQTIGPIAYTQAIYSTDVCICIRVGHRLKT